MAGVMNNTARQFNLKCIGKERKRVTVRLAPGFNVVEDTHWDHFFKGTGKSKKADPYLQSLKDDGSLDYGTKMDDLELERDPDTKSKSKATPKPANKKKK